jgi:hypothetical protein
MLHWLYDLFKTWKLDLFKWWIKVKLNNIKFFNPLIYLKLYFDEKKMTYDKSLQKELYERIISNNYEIIIAHSMWTLLLFNTLETYWVPDNLKKIVTIQSDLNFDLKIKNNDFLKRLENKELIWKNYFNALDPQLIVSTFINKKKRLWMWVSKSNLIQNHYHKIKWLNRHIYSINNVNFINELIN